MSSGEQSAKTKQIKFLLFYYISARLLSFVLRCFLGSSALFRRATKATLRSVRATQAKSNLRILCSGVETAPQRSSQKAKIKDKKSSAQKVTKKRQLQKQASKTQTPNKKCLPIFGVFVSRKFAFLHLKRLFELLFVFACAIAAQLKLSLRGAFRVFVFALQIQVKRKIQLAAFCLFCASFFLLFLLFLASAFALRRN